MSYSDQDDFKNTLNRRLRHFGIEKEATAASILYKTNKIESRQFEAIRFKDNTITLRVNNAIVAEELKYALTKLTVQIKTVLNWPPTRPLKIRIVLH